ncbi:hypothetical protein [Pontibacter korlensis]|uniref:hypothetical protein n=1 Tax=Pontibacter korlensis TaxID=400092 RepID=UPI0039EF47DE
MSDLSDDARFLSALVAVHSDGVDPSVGDGAVSLQLQRVVVDSDLLPDLLLRLRYQERLRGATGYEEEYEER